MTLQEREIFPTPTQYSHSLKIEQTAKGARVTAHVSANSGPEAIEQAINLYRLTKLQLEQRNEIIAPVANGE